MSRGRARPGGRSRRWLLAGGLALGLGCLLVTALVSGARSDGRRELRACEAPELSLSPTVDSLRPPAAAPDAGRTNLAPGTTDAAPRGTLAGLVARVATPAGEPIGRATLLLRHGARVVERRALDAMGLDTAGAVRFTGLVPGRYSLELEPEGLPPGLLPVPSAVSGTSQTPVVLARGRTGEVTLLATWAGRLRGRVLDSEGLPVAQARLRLQATNAGLEVSALEVPSDERGFFALDGILPGTYRAKVYWPEGSRGAAPPPRRLEIEPDAELALVLRGEAEPQSVHGRLLDADGRPLAGELVQCEWVDGEAEGTALASRAEWSRILAQARTDAEGRYRLVGLPLAAVRVRAAPQLGQARGFGLGHSPYEEALTGLLDLGAGPGVLDAGTTVLQPRARGGAVRAVATSRPAGPEARSR